MTGGVVHARVVNARLEILEERQLHDRAAVGAEGGVDGRALHTTAIGPHVNVILGVRVQTGNRVGGVVSILLRALAGSEAGRTVFDEPCGSTADFGPVEGHRVGCHGIHHQVNRVLTHGDVIQRHIVQTEVVAAVALAGAESDVLAIARVIRKRIFHKGVFIVRQIGSRNRIQDLKRGRVALVGHHTQLQNHRSGGGSAAHPEINLQLVQADALIHLRHDGDVGDVGAVVETDGVGRGMRRGGRIHLDRLARIRGVTIPTIDVSIGTGAIGVGVKVLHVRQGHDGLALGAEGDGLRPVALAIGTAQSAHADLVHRVGIQTGKRVGSAGNRTRGVPVRIGAALVLDLAVLRSIRIVPGNLSRRGVGCSHSHRIRGNAGDHVAGGQTDVVDLGVQRARGRHVVDTPVITCLMGIFALRTVGVRVDGVELGIAVVHLAAGDVVDDQQQVVGTVVVEVGVEGDIDPTVGAGVVERDRTGIDVHIAVRRGGPHVLHKLVVGGVRHVDIQRAGDHLAVIVLERHAAELCRHVVEIARQVNLLGEGVEVMVGHREVVALGAVGRGRVAVVDSLDRSQARRGEVDRHGSAEVTATTVGLHGHGVSGLLAQAGQDVVGLGGRFGGGQSGGIRHGDDVLHRLANGVGLPVQGGVRTIDVIEREVDNRRAGGRHINRDIIHINISIRGTAVVFEGDVRFARSGASEIGGVLIVSVRGREGERLDRGERAGVRRVAHHTHRHAVARVGRPSPEVDHQGLHRIRVHVEHLGQHHHIIVRGVVHVSVNALGTGMGITAAVCIRIIVGGNAVVALRDLRRGIALQIIGERQGHNCALRQIDLHLAERAAGVDGDSLLAGTELVAVDFNAVQGHRLDTISRVGSDGERDVVGAAASHRGGLGRHRAVH